MKIEIKVLDPARKIMLQVVGPDLTAKDVDDSTLVMMSHVKKWGTGWKMLLDLRGNNIISPEAQQGVIRQQKVYIENGCVMVASVVPSSLKKLQQGKLHKDAKNEIDTMFVDFDEALEFLRKF